MEYSGKNHSNEELCIPRNISHHQSRRAEVCWIRIRVYVCENFNFITLIMPPKLLPTQMAN